MQRRKDRKLLDLWFRDDPSLASSSSSRSGGGRTQLKQWRVVATGGLEEQIEWSDRIIIREEKSRQSTRRGDSYLLGWIGFQQSSFMPLN